MEKLEDSRRERKKRESRARILKTARNLFKTKGFDDTSVEDLCNGADISKGTFFNYFPSKEALLEAIGEEEAMDFKYYVDVDLKDVKSPSEKIYMAMKFAILDTISFERLIGRVILYSVGDEGIKNHALDNVRKTIEFLVAEAQEAEEIKRDESAYDISVAIMGMYFSIMIHGNNNRSSKGIQEAHFESLVAILKRGIAVLE